MNLFLYFVRMALKLLRFPIVSKLNASCLFPGHVLFECVSKCCFQAAKTMSIYANHSNSCYNLNVFSNFLDKVYFWVPLRSNSTGNPQTSLLPDNTINRKSTNTELVFRHSVSEKVSEVERYLSTLSRKKNVCDSDWADLKDFMLSAGKFINVNNKNVETMIMKFIDQCEYLNLARSYLLFLQSNNTNVNMVTFSIFLRLMYKRWSDHVPGDKKIVENLCDEMLKVPLLECTVAMSLICGLCLTERWKESLRVIEKFKELYDIPFSGYTPIIKTAFINNEIDFGFKLLEDKVSDGCAPDQSVYEYMLEYNLDKKAVLNRLIKFLAEHNEELEIGPAKVIFKEVQNLQMKRTGSLLSAMTEVTNKGVCRHCGSTLKSAVLSDEEFEKLKSPFLDSVLVGKDIFRKTNPEELERFQMFLKETGPYDFVLDGLNIAYAVGFKNNSSDVFAKVLENVVKFFVQQKKKVLILGRKHMASWPKGPMESIKKNAHMFLIDNLSQDDPYLLHATLYSGMNCNFVSRDMMRGHKYLFNVQNPDLNSLFWRWQCTHQYVLIYVKKNGSVLLKEPVTYLQRAHYVKVGSEEGRWHVPCRPPDDSFVPGHKKFNRKLWLCLPEL